MSRDLATITTAKPGKLRGHQVKPAVEKKASPRLLRILKAAEKGTQDMKAGRGVNVTDMSDADFLAVVKRARVRG